MLLRNFSNALGFSKKCLLEANALIDELEYDRSAWWNEISDEPVSSKNNIVSIHNPTLRVFVGIWGLFSQIIQKFNGKKLKLTTNARESWEC